MSKIQSIHINNFKFFGDSKAIELGGNNLLLYGENGSGKSSITQAILKLLECVTTTPDDITQMFSSNSDANQKSLLNIHTNGNNEDAFVEIIDDSGRTYKMSAVDNGLQENMYLVESYRSSEFINYQSLFAFQQLRDDRNYNWHDVFEYAVNPYVKTGTFEYLGEPLRNLAVMLSALRDQKRLLEPSVNNPQKQVIYAKNQPFQSFLRLLDRVNEELDQLVDYLDKNVNKIIKNLKYDFEVSFALSQAIEYEKHDSWIKIIEYVITLTLEKYEGKNVKVKDPAKFLNEAKMAALAFAIRWAIATRGLMDDAAPEALRVLVLDDLMISLDMGNRDRLLDFILDDIVLSKYQIVFMTHERSLFENVGHRLKIKYHLQDMNLEPHGWIVKEMYDHEVDKKHFPMILPAESPIGRALAYYKGNDRPIDYSACGNALRQAIEGELKRLFKLWRLVDGDGEIIDWEPRMLRSLVETGMYEFPKHGYGVEKLEKLDLLREFVLNPTSHYNPTSNFYKEELDSAFEIYNTLHEMQTREIVPCDAVLAFKIDTIKGGSRQYEICVLKELYAQYNPKRRKYEFHDVQFQGKIREVGQDFHNIRGSFKKIYEETIDFINAESPIDKTRTLFDEIFYNGKSLNQIVAEICI